MPYIAYQERAFKPPSLLTIQRAEQICIEYANQGYGLTLRQLYYQFVSRAWIPNTERSYKNLGSVINDARLCGLLDWNHLTDRTRGSSSRGHWDNPRELMRAAAQQFHLDYWADQDMHVEVWVEKEALADVVSQVATRFDLTWLACRGYLSQSESWRSARRLMRKIRDDRKRVVILHLGDHDPSGIDMTRDNAERMANFIAHDIGAASGEDVTADDLTVDDPWNAESLVGWSPDGPLFEFRRIALTMDQVGQYNPPPNPAKQTDSRFADYEALYGDESWELDALPPNVLDALIEEHIRGLMDENAFDAAVAREADLRERATALVTRYGHELD